MTDGCDADSGQIDRRPGGAVDMLGIGHSGSRPAVRLDHRGAGARERCAPDDGDPGLRPSRANGRVSPRIEPSALRFKVTRHPTESEGAALGPWGVIDRGTAVLADEVFLYAG